MRLRVGVDVGGTFTDFAAVDVESGRKFTLKVRSTPDDPSRAIVQGTGLLLAEAGAKGGDVAFFGHGTTVVTNMILERKGARLGIVTTRGFRDVLELARQARPDVYDYSVHRPPPLAPRRHRFEIGERVAADGSVIDPIDPREVASLAKRIEDEGLEAIAVCFLHAYAEHKNERAAAEILRSALPEVFVTASHAVATEYREFERFSTTAMNAFVGPRADRYFAALSAGLARRGIACPAYTVTSNAGLIDETTARALPIRTALSGPAAGVAGIGRLLAGHSFGDLVTLDVGGTSTDVAIIRGGRPGRVRARTIGGYSVLAPMVDIEVIGAGGGSHARIDHGGALTVGPDSAGADPGPVAYRKGGTIPTVTDAALVLGRLDAAAPLAGLTLDSDAAAAAIRRDIAEPLGLDIDEGAEAILAIATANMARTIRSVATARGIEPGTLSLVAYGGAGPLLGADVAAVLGLKRVIVPAEPGTLCARAVLVSDIARDFSLTRITALDKLGWPLIEEAFAGMAGDGDAWLASEGVPSAARRQDRVIEARYAGQNFEIAVPVLEHDDSAEMRRRFDESHLVEQGFMLDGRPVEAVTLRLRAYAAPDGARSSPAILTPVDPVPAVKRPVRFAGTRHSTVIRARMSVGAAETIVGPAILAEATATTVVPPGWQATVHADGTLVMDREGA